MEALRGYQECLSPEPSWAPHGKWEGRLWKWRPQEVLIRKNRSYQRALQWLSLKAQGGIKNKHSSYRDFSGLRVWYIYIVLLIPNLKGERGKKKFGFLTLFLEKASICSCNLSLKRMQIAKKPKHAFPGSPVGPPSKKNSGREAGQISMPDQGRWMPGWFPSRSLLPQKAKLPLGSHCQHSTQTMAWLSHIGHSIFFCESPPLHNEHSPSFHRRGSECPSATII